MCGDVHYSATKEVNWVIMIKFVNLDLQLWGAGENAAL